MDVSPKNSQLSVALVVISCLLGLATNAGCGDSSGESTGMPQIGRRAAPAQAAPTASIITRQPEGFVTHGITRRRYSDDARDPMTRPYPAEIGAVLDQIQLPIAMPEDPVDRGPLADFSPDQLRLVGILSRTAQPIAIFAVPGSNRNVFATLDMIVGPNAQGRITDIQPNRVIISYENLMLPGQPVQTRDISLRSFPTEFDTVEFVEY